MSNYNYTPPYSSVPYGYTDNIPYITRTNHELSHGEQQSQLDSTSLRGGTSMRQNYSQDSNESGSSFATYSSTSSIPALRTASRTFDNGLRSVGIELNDEGEYDEAYDEIEAYEEREEQVKPYAQGYYGASYYTPQGQIPYNYGQSYNNVQTIETSARNGPQSSNSLEYAQDLSSSSQEGFKQDYDEYLAASRKAGHCAWPECKSSGIFKRDADLIRHVEENHQPNKALFYCDYEKCKRHNKPFRRKSHYKDHLRTYHHELLSIGRSRSQPVDREERPSISSKWWRCSECLQRNYIQRSGYQCENSDCGIPCEPHRVAMIKRKMESRH